MTDSVDPIVAERRLRRVLFTFLLLVSVVVLSLCAWNVLERKGLARRLAALRASGAPAEPADLRTPPIADASNAVVELRAAARLIDSGAATWKAADELYSLRLPFSEKHFDVLRAAIAPNAGAAPLVDAAMRKPGLDWGLAFQTPMNAMLLPDLNEQRALASQLRYEALVAHQQGDDATALRRIEQVLFIARAMQRQPIRMGQLVSLGICAVACESIEDITSDLRVGSDPGDASEVQVSRMMVQLLGESESQAGMILGLQGERVMAADTLKAMAEGLLSKSNRSGIGSIPSLKPFDYRNASGAIDHMNVVVDLARETKNWPGFRDRFAAAPTPVKSSPRMCFLAGLFVSSIELTVEQHYRVAAQRRLSATSLAIAMYRAKHGGAFPQTLDALVPDLLPAVPQDPLAGSGEPIGYVSDPKRPRIYSVGANGIDNGGQPVDETKRRYENERGADDVVDLLRQSKPPEPEPDGDSN